ncbi:hypothetical protein LRS03_08820 [Rhizobacter sp. J219]|nr:hypothetical protein [Rhizobacter sp. J219]MCR5882952.1 hypothetical protein [Rhizobacter sp. J219]
MRGRGRAASVTSFGERSEHGDAAREDEAGTDGAGFHLGLAAFQERQRRVQVHASRQRVVRFGGAARNAREVEHHVDRIAGQVMVEPGGVAQVTLKPPQDALARRGIAEGQVDERKVPQRAPRERTLAGEPRGQRVADETVAPGDQHVHGRLRSPRRRAGR